MHKEPQLDELNDELSDSKISCTKILMCSQGCCHLIFVLLGFGIGLIALTSWSDLSNQDKFIFDYIQNWELRPIVDIQVTKSDRGPSGYVNLINRMFSTEIGGECDNDDFSGSVLSVGNGDIDQIANGCQRVHPVGPALLSKFYGYKICGLREGENFLEIERPIRKDEYITCSNNKKICGSGDINTSFCVSQSYQGPINEIYVITKNTPIQKDFKSADLNDGYKLVFTDKFNAMPIIRFDISEGKMGFNSNHYRVHNNRIPYKLLTEKYCNQKYRIKEYDPRFRPIGLIREDTLFYDNGIYDKMAELPLYNISESTEFDWTLYTNNYYYWSYHCDSREATSRHRWIEILNNITEVHSNNNYILATSIFYAIGVGMILMYFFAYFTVLVFSHKNEVSTPIRNLFLVIGYPVRMVFGGFLIYFSYICISSIIDYQDTIISITVSNGLPDFTSNAFFTYQQPLQSVYRVCYSVAVLSILSFVVILMDLAIELSVRGILKSAYGKFYAEFAE